MAIMKKKPMVFICHASEDEVVARTLYDLLTEAGLKPWLDKESLKAGDQWNEEIEAALKKADYVVVLNSWALIGKPESYVMREINFILDRKRSSSRRFRFIFPIRIDDAELLWELENFQSLDLSTEADSLEKNKVHSLISAIESDYKVKVNLVSETYKRYKNIYMAAYRYPGARPFDDTPMDRRLFFGREGEIEWLSHKVVTSNLMVLFGKSGLGKTSLVNAGLNEKLREKGFMPLPVRFNDPELEPRPTVFARIEDLARKRNMDYEHGEEGSLGEFFETSTFWGSGERLMKPVLILDQFEEFFVVHGPEARQRFIGELADLLRGVAPERVTAAYGKGENGKGGFPYSEKAPEVKVLISIREDFLCELEELATAVPGVLHNRFRLLPLNREQAKRCIEEPARLQGEGIEAAGFSFAPETVTGMLDFLCRRKERGEVRQANEVEAFQLQLLCRYGEERASQLRSEKGEDISLKLEDLGGEKGMGKVLEDFYSARISAIGGWWQRRLVRKLCERGLISGSGRRLSLEEEDIEDRFSVSPLLLGELVDGRLLRAEPRVGGIYYELSHTLVAPIRKVYRRRVNRLKIGIPMLLLCVCIAAIGGIRLNKNIRINELYAEVGELESNKSWNAAREKYEAILKIDKRYVKAYVGMSELENQQPEQKIKIYERALANGVEDARIYRLWGDVLLKKGKADEAITRYRKALDLNAGLLAAHEGLGDAYRYQMDYKKTIEKYLYVLKRSDQNTLVLSKIIISYIEDERFGEAIEFFKKALELNAGNATIYVGIANALRKKGREDLLEQVYDMAFKTNVGGELHFISLGYCYNNIRKYEKGILAYKKAIDINPNAVVAYNDLGTLYLGCQRYNEAVEVLKTAIKVKPNFAKAYVNLGTGYSYLKKYEDAITAHKKAIAIKPDYALAYFNLGNEYSRIGRYDDAITAYNRAIIAEPEYIIPKINLAELYLNSGRFRDAEAFALEVLKRKNVPVENILAMRLISITSSLLLNNKHNAHQQLSLLFKYYRAIPKEFERNWLFKDFREFITGRPQLASVEKRLLLQLADLLESPLEEGKKKVDAVEKRAKELFKDFEP